MQHRFWTVWVDKVQRGREIDGKLLDVLGWDVEGPGAAIVSDVPPVVVGLGQQDVALVGFDGDQNPIPTLVLVFELHQDQTQT